MTRTNFIKDTRPKTNTTRGGRKAHRPTPFSAIWVGKVLGFQMTRGSCEKFRTFQFRPGRRARLAHASARAPAGSPSPSRPPPRRRRRRLLCHPRRRSHPCRLPPCRLRAAACAPSINCTKLQLSSFIPRFQLFLNLGRKTSGRNSCARLRAAGGGRGLAGSPGRG